MSDTGEKTPCRWCGYVEDHSGWHYEDCPVMDDPMVKFHIDKNYEMQKELKRLHRLFGLAVHHIDALKEIVT